MRRKLVSSIAVGTVTARVLPLVLALLAANPALADDEIYEKNIRPLLIEKCGGCHNPQAKTGGLDLTTPEGLRHADREAGLLQAPDANASRLMQVVRWQGKVKMPPTGQLSPAQVGLLERWIQGGARLPGESPNEAAKNGGQKSKGASHWAFQPVRKPVLPKVQHRDRVRNEVDLFIFQRLEEAGLKPPAEADKLTLLRRATFDLHGLPPTPEEIRAFLADTAPDAYERLIDRLLASPRYGERWGRHWLDVARYAQTGGIDENVSYREAWRYGEYVIDAFNRDLPFDQFIVEQLAGDVLHKGTNDYIRGRIATGFLALGPKAIVEQDKTKQLYDVIDEQIDTTSKAFLGLTISCARCHDHKFDPISTEDYYALASIFRSTRLYETLEGRSSTLFFTPLVPDEVYDRYRKRQDEIAAKQLEIEALIEPEVTDYVYRELHPKLADYMVASWHVEKKGRSAQKVAQDRGLDARILEKLAKYLKPDGSFRPFLTEWHESTEANVGAVAEKYVALIQDPARRWRNILEKWAKEVQLAVANGKQPPPKVRFEGFAFTRESERFFGDISFLKSTFNEKDREDGAFAIPEGERKRYLAAATRKKVELLEQELAELKRTAPSRPMVAHGVAEGEPFEQRVFIRGNHANLGKPVPKRFPVVLAGYSRPRIETVSGRLELAHWIASPANPLTARVAVNRIWLWHFGQGLVRTPDNFGLRGELPTHPELLDYLAARFVEEGWSIKAMHRLLMTSSTYRFSSQTDSERWEKDPGNRLWSRFQRRRLSAEEIRDAWLAVDGSLDLRTGSFLDPVPGTRADARGGRTKMDEHFRRTVYLPVDRNNLATMMVLFDFADSTTSTGQRGETYIAPQALYLMNNEFFEQRAVGFAKRLLERRDLTDRERIGHGVLHAWGRSASEEEMDLMLKFLAEYPKRADQGEVPRAWVGLCRLIVESNNFFYVD